MKQALVENGPLSVSFEVYDDFMMYKTGVYHHTGMLKSKLESGTGSFDPFEVDITLKIIHLEQKYLFIVDKPCSLAGWIWQG